MRHKFRSLPVAIALLALAATISARDVQAQTCAAATGSMSNLIANVSAVCDAALNGAGVVAGSGTTAAEFGAGGFHQTVITFTARAVTCTDEAGVVLYCGTKVYDFPDGVLVILGGTFDGTVTATGSLTATADGDIGVGTVTASNNGTLASTEQNIIPTTPITQLVSSTGPADAWTTTAVATVEGWASANADAYLNLLFDDADHDGGGVTVSGTLTITWLSLNTPAS